MNLTSLANIYESDKGTEAGAPPHKYTYLYDLIFYPFRNKEFTLLEMGLAVGGPEIGGPMDRRVDSPSIAMWSRYFPKAKLIGFDISDFTHLTSERFKFIRGDSGSAEDMHRLENSASQFDIIIDDASHASYHQQLALKYLWNKLSNGGLYIIEDLHWQSPYFENELPKVPTTAEFLRRFFESEEYLPNEVISCEFMNQIKSEAFSCSLFPAFDGNSAAIKMAVLRKRE